MNLKTSNGETLIMVEQKEFGELKEKVTSIEKDTSRIWKHLDGNGRAGLSERTTRIEESLKDITEDISSNSNSIKLLNDNVTKGFSEINKSLGRIEGLLEVHINDKYKHNLPGLFRSAPYNFILWFVTVSIVGHVILTAILPPNISLWELVSKWLGL